MVAQWTDADLDQALRALAHPVRRDILRRTVSGWASVSDLASDYTMSFAAVQKHVAALQAAGLVEKVPVGRERRVRAVPDKLARVRASLQQLEALWRHRLDALDDLLTEPRE